jgi:hypothetical protein
MPRLHAHHGAQPGGEGRRNGIGSNSFGSRYFGSRCFGNGR